MKTAITIAVFAAGISGVIGAAGAQQAPPAGAAGAPGQAPTAEIRKAMVWKRFEYLCDGNAKVIVYLREQTAKVRYADKQYLMKQTVSADGNRYSDGKLVWWGKGNGGFLQQDTPDGNGAMLVKDCTLVEPEKPDPGVVSGTVTYLQRMALPPTAVVEVKLQDVSKADTPATVIAEQKITTGGKQVPIAFELKYDPAKIEGKHRYAVSARILFDGQLRFTSDKAYPVLGDGVSTSGVEIVVKQVSAKP
jgi:putative lipoprotein